MSLREKQSKFVVSVAQLIIFASNNNIELTFGDAFAKTGHKDNSNHYIRLAIDLNAFVDGNYLSAGPEMEAAHNKLHDYWDTLGGAKRIKGDLNHYAISHEGRS
jgi:hypothetical protein